MILHITKVLRRSHPKPNNCYPNIKSWSKNHNILLLNSSLTVIKRAPGSHQHIWDKYIKNVLQYINDNSSGKLFVGWGALATSTILSVIDRKKHYFYTTTHPSTRSFKVEQDATFRDIEKIMNKENLCK